MRWILSLVRYGIPRFIRALNERSDISINEDRKRYLIKMGEW